MELTNSLWWALGLIIFTVGGIFLSLWKIKKLKKKTSKEETLPKENISSVEEKNMEKSRDLTAEEKRQGLKKYSILHEKIEYEFDFEGTYEEFVKWFKDYIVKTFPVCILCHRIIVPFKGVCTCSNGLFHVGCDADISGFCGYMDEDGKVRSEENLGEYKNVEAST